MPSKTAIVPNRANAAPLKFNQKKMAKAETGPSFYEVDFLRQMKEELEIFLRSKNFSTIKEFEIAFSGDAYEGLMQVHV